MQYGKRVYQYIFYMLMGCQGAWSSCNVTYYLELYTSRVLDCVHTNQFPLRQLSLCIKHPPFPSPSPFIVGLFEFRSISNMYLYISFSYEFYDF